MSLNYILNTHHCDHVGANLDLKKNMDCKIIGNKKDSSRIPGIDIKLNEGDFFEIGHRDVKLLMYLVTQMVTLHFISAKKM